MSRTALVWVLSVGNGLLAVAAVNAVYTALSSPGIWLVPLWLAAPYGAFTGWRASVYVRRLLNGTARHWQPPLEGFALMALSTVGYGIRMVMRAEFDTDASVTAMSAYTAVAVPVGLFGAIVAAALMLLDMAIVKSVAAPKRVAG